MGTLERQVLKICQRSIENYETREFAKKNPEKIVIGNRCIYDHLAYNEAFYLLGWLTKEERNKTFYSAKELFLPDLVEPYAIVLNPGFEKTKERLEKRWKSNKKKWNEENMDYLATVCKVYETFSDSEKILYLTDNEEAEVIKAIEWLEEIKDKNIKEKNNNYLTFTEILFAS